MPSLAALAFGVVAGWVAAPGYAVDAAAAVALVLPVTLASHAATRLWSRRNPAGAFYGLLVGVILRGLVIVGGGGLLFVLTDEFRARGVSLWLWVIAVYLSTLAVELILLVARPRSGNDSPR